MAVDSRTVNRNHDNYAFGLAKATDHIAVVVIVVWSIVTIRSKRWWADETRLQSQESVANRRNQTITIRDSSWYFDQQRFLTSTALPHWLVAYTQWHADLRERDKGKYLIIECVQGQVCGGLADRLRFLPVALLVAHRTNRLLILRWTKPRPLEEFLLPPATSDDSNWSKGTSSLDWRAGHHPSLREIIQLSHSSVVGRWFGAATGSKSWCPSDKTSTNDPYKVPHSNDVDAPSVVYFTHPDKAMYKQRLVFFQNEGGCDQLNSSYARILRAVLFHFFRPTSELMGELEAQRLRLGLEWGQYNAAHLRARHPSLLDWYHHPYRRQRSWFRGRVMLPGTKRSIDADGLRLEDQSAETKDQILADARHAIHCAEQLQRTRTNDPTFMQDSFNDNVVYFASDTADVVERVVGKLPLAAPATAGHVSTVSVPIGAVQVRGMETPMEHLHLGRGKSWLPAKAYYPLFVDLFLLGGARCVAVGLGGYGLLGGVLSSASDCVAQHMVASNHTITHLCKLMDPTIVPVSKSKTRLQCPKS